MAANQKQATVDNRQFMACRLKVDVETLGWQKIVAAVLSNIQVTSKFKMEKDGTFEVSGMVEPNVLLKMLAKAGNKVEVCWWQFGPCSSNLSIPEKKPQYYDEYGRGNYYYYYGDDDGYNSEWSQCVEDSRHLQYERGYRDCPRPKFQYPALEAPPPSKPAPKPQTSPKAETKPQSGEGGQQCCVIM